MFISIINMIKISHVVCKMRKVDGDTWRDKGLD